MGGNKTHKSEFAHVDKNSPMDEQMVIVWLASGSVQEASHWSLDGCATAFKGDVYKITRVE